jgi:integrase
LRHTSVTAVYRASRDLFLAQRFARHASPLTTTIYTHVSDEELSQRLRDLPC